LGSGIGFELFDDAAEKIEERRLVSLCVTLLRAPYPKRNGARVVVLWPVVKVSSALQKKSRADEPRSSVRDLVDDLNTVRDLFGVDVDSHFCPYAVCACET
jgi:hypothetical protein